VTGTNGKTTVAWMIAQSLERLGSHCGYVGTLGYGVGELRGDDHLTTPAAVDLQCHLCGFVDSGASHAALEVSSHALSQMRVAGVRFDAVLFTNLSRDHLDYHGDMQSYFDSKARLFLDSESQRKIINVDTESGLQLAALCGEDVVTVSAQFDRAVTGRPYVFVRSVVARARGSDVTFASSWGNGCFSLAMPGEFNVANAVLVLACLLSSGVALEECCAALAEVDSPPGRMQRILTSGPAVYVDYAHTPDAIQSALRALRPHCRGKLWCVFGCGGDRDTGKRPQMGGLVARLSDRVVVTSDNPRTESPEKIIQEIVSGIGRSAEQLENLTVIEDRAVAIAWSIGKADDADVILVAGKGHENYQQIGARRTPFSDSSIATAALEAREGGA
jgi:UDP-N-acetylmuramoyl-L-alanyl-D-glutamate--2,6-diaminopimelate ligase